MDLMHRRLFLLLLVGVSTSLHAEDPPLSVILTGSLPSELAPHGKGNVYAPSVLIEEGRWRMWYGGQGNDGHDRIHLAESSDGKNWTKGGVVLENGDALHVNDPSVFRREGKYWMYYTHAGSESRDTIHVATSTDGNAWTKEGEVLGPGPEGSFDSLQVARPSVMHENGTFKMWYDGRKDVPPSPLAKGLPTSEQSSRSVGYATSKDGLHWDRHGEPVFGEDAGAVDVSKIGKHYLMLFESALGTRVTTSKDGLAWKPSGKFIHKTYTAADEYGHVTPHLVFSSPQEPTYLFLGCARAQTLDHNTIGLFPLSTATLLHNLASE